MTIKPVADLYLITYEDGRPYKYTHEAGEAIDAIGAGFKAEEFVSLENHRAAMLQAEPVSNSDELPPDYLQGHKDGLEWAAQLAEANHPQTGDWLYDDPIELVRAIRKGPDMPTVQAGNSPVIPDGNGSSVGKALTITLPDTSSKAFWSGTGKSEVFHPETYKCWAKEAIERACVISGIGVVVK